MRMVKVLLVLVIALAAANASADITASLYVGGGVQENWPNATGWFFTPTTNVTVTMLGVYDHGNPGLADAHDVGIFLANGTPVVSTTVPAGTLATLIDGSRFVPVSPVVLQATQQYYIEGNNWGTDLFAYGAGSVTYAPEIQWNGYGDAVGNSIFSSVTNYGGVPGNLGPNFTYVPEPATMTLLALGGVLLARRRRV